MRLDVFLKTSRLLPRRSLANECAKKGLVLVNKVKAKASKGVGPGDLITVSYYNRRKTVKVLAVPATKNVSRKQAPELYELLEETIIDDWFE